MKNLLLALLLISPASFADWGDVYYCQETSHSSTTPTGKLASLPTGKFQFKLHKDKRTMVYGSKGKFSDETFRLATHDLSQETWYARDDLNSMVVFSNGRHMRTFTSIYGTESSTADCEKF